MTQAYDADRSALGKLRYDDLLSAGVEAKPEKSPQLSPRISSNPDTAADDLVRLVLSLVDTVRQLVERQAIRRVEGGHLSDDQIERLGMTLLQLEQRMTEMKSLFGLENEDLTLRLGALQDLMDVSTEEIGSFE
ncbi:MAG: gas vesicle protein K [Xanthobacteraceae bacterium]|nr:gas vesicle protein K [Xanthobacteraceae bacterium]